MFNLTQDEFTTLMKHHGCSYPIKDWLAKQEDGRGIMQSWYRTCKDQSLSDLMAASDRLSCGDEKQPTGYNNHPRSLRMIAQKIKEQRNVAAGLNEVTVVDGTIVYACSKCQDCGRRTIVRHNVIEKIEKLGRWPDDVSSVHYAVACNCSLGTGVFAQQRRSPVTGRLTPPLPVFNERHMIEYLGENKDEIVEKVLAR